MRIIVSLSAVVALAMLTGCAGPENKFGRGFNNLTEIVQLREMSRSVEQTALWDGSNQQPLGVARGFTRTMARTGVGIYEVVTFPIPPYGPVLKQTNPLYPDYSVKTRRERWGGLEMPEVPGFPQSYKPGLPAGPTFETDASLGFSGGEVAPRLPGSKFRVLGY